MYFTYMRDVDRPRAIEGALPVRPRDFFVLLVLAGGDLHGYGIMKAVARESRGSVTLEVGSLYRTLDRLLEAGLIEEGGGGGATVAAAAEERPAAADEMAADAMAEGAAEGAAAAGERRRYYRLTAFGLEVMRAEAARLLEVVRLVRAKGLLRGAGGP